MEESATQLVQKIYELLYEKPGAYARLLSPVTACGYAKLTTTVPSPQRHRGQRAQQDPMSRHIMTVRGFRCVAAALVCRLGSVPDAGLMLFLQPDRLRRAHLFSLG